VLFDVVGQKGTSTAVSIVSSSITPIEFIDKDVNTVNFKTNNGIINIFTDNQNGITNFTFDSQFQVYPNPSSTHIIVDIGKYSTMGSYTAKIVNTAGQEVFQSVINQQQFVIDAKTMGGAGVYTLYITDTNNKVIGVKKIVLQ
jgi:hypothetical protein